MARLFPEMLGLQGLEGEHVREDRAAGHAGDEVGDRTAASLWLEQIHDHHGDRLVNGRPFPGGTGDREQSHREPLQDRRGPAHVLRGDASMLSRQRMVPAYTGD